MQGPGLVRRREWKEAAPEVGNEARQKIKEILGCHGKVGPGSWASLVCTGVEEASRVFLGSTLWSAGSPTAVTNM